MLGAALLLLGLLLAAKSIGRIWGVAMLAAYSAYMAFLFSDAPVRLRPEPRPASGTSGAPSSAQSGARGPPLVGVGPSRSGRMSVPRPADRRNPAEGPLQSSASATRRTDLTRRRPPPRACRRSRFRRGRALRPAGKAGLGTGPRRGTRRAEPQILRDPERRLALGRALRVQGLPRGHVVTADSRPASTPCVRWYHGPHLIPGAAPGRVPALGFKTDWRPAGRAKLPARALRSFPIAWLIDCTLGHRRARGPLACRRSFGGRRHDGPPAASRRRPSAVTPARSEPRRRATR